LILEFHIASGAQVPKLKAINWFLFKVDSSQSINLAAFAAKFFLMKIIVNLFEK